jgi:hypothetical protein
MTKQKIVPITYSNGQIVFNRYRILNEIARGGMNSIIYTAIDEENLGKSLSEIIKKKVCIKVINRNENTSDDD